ncbi:Transcription factor jumonji JmjN [Penicillium expansum]|nr:Transcription factor jumonji JmjN [Penicillium expansum]
MMATALDQSQRDLLGSEQIVESVSITPPQSANGKKEAPEGVPSELSDLELDHQSAPAPDTTKIKQEEVEEKVEEIEEIEPDHYYGGGKVPVFKPTMDQFRDFQSFINKINKYGMQAGIVKVIPRKNGKSESLPPLDEAVKKIRVKNPIMQEFHGSHGTYTQANIERQRSYNLPQWKERVNRAAPTPRPPSARPEGQKRRPGRPPKRANQVKVKEEPPADDAEKSRLEGPPTPVSPETNPVQPKTEDLSEGESLPTKKPKGRQPRSVTSRRKNNRGDAMDQVDEEAYTGFDYRIHDHEEYTAERCEELETNYWKSLMFNNPMYGADMPGSLFEDSTETWNVAKLPNLLDVLGQKVPGVNTAYLYMGMWKATFAWHLEDVDLYSINYIHFGAPKQWYSISQEDAPRFEQVMRSIWSTFSNRNMGSPSIDWFITKGEFVITFPYGYHSGYNIGYNCAESVNFATEQWLDYARIAKKCNCEADSVWIDVDEIERKLRGESTPEYYGEFESEFDGFEGASDLLTPPRSVPEKTSTRGRKRKNPSDGPSTKRPKLHPEGPRKLPCLLCPNNLDYEDLLPTEDGKGHAHRRCAAFIEETTILRDASGTEVVCDIDKIPKARLGLKCLFCREVRGACFQCNFGKCTRAYHATCALLAGVQVEHGAIAVIADDGTQYSIPSVDLKCKFHRQKRPNGVLGESSDVDRRVIESARRLVQGNLIQFQADKEINGAIVLENRPSERSLLLKVLPRGDVIEMPYRWMLVVRKSNFTPLALGIQPLPAHLARKPEQRKELESAVPAAGSAFGDSRSPYQWAEFETVDGTRNQFAPLRTVNLQGEQMWYYLGMQSTESRAQYTHNPSVSIHNPRANFLDSVKSLGVGVSARASKISPHHFHYAATAPAPLYQRNLTQSQNQQNIYSSNVNAPHLQSRPPSSALQHLAPPPPFIPVAGAAAGAPAMPSAFRTLPQSARHAPYPSVVKSHAQQQHHLPSTNTFANVRELIARRRLAQITDHANVFAGYTIVSPELVVETLLGPYGLNTTGQWPREAGAGYGPAAGSATGCGWDFAAASDSEHAIGGGHSAPSDAQVFAVDRGSVAAAKMPGKYAYLDQQRSLAPNVYQSPYNMPSGLSEYAKATYGLVPAADDPPKPSLANDYFNNLPQEHQEKILKACGSFVQRAIERSATHSRQSSSSNLRLSAALAQQTENPTIDITPVEDPPLLSGLDMPLHADSPCSSFGRSHLRFQSPNEFPIHGPDPHPDHHDLFGDQQLNTRFWQNGPWVGGDGNTPNDENRPFFGPHIFGPHERLKHDYASSDISLGKGPGSLHSVDMAGFGPDLNDDLGLSP